MVWRRVSTAQVVRLRGAAAGACRSHVPGYGTGGSLSSFSTTVGRSTVLGAEMGEVKAEALQAWFLLAGGPAQQAWLQPSGAGEGEAQCEEALG